MHIIYGLGLLFGCSGRLRQKGGSTDSSNTGRTGESNKNELCGYMSPLQLCSAKEFFLEFLLLIFEAGTIYFELGMKSKMLEC